MNTYVKNLAALFFLVLLFSFKAKDPQLFIGTYGVSNIDPSNIQLKIKADKTFYYQDFSNPAKKIMVTGTWENKANKVYLHASNASQKFHDVWEIESNQQVATARKGLCFYRLCRLAE